ncbi:MAG: DUF1553 domain-containing protein [Pirellulaceae bacterium]
MQRGGVSGAPISDDPNESLLLRVMRHEIEGLEMPEGGARLSPAVLADFERWIGMGAPDPRDQPPSASDLAKATSWETIRDKRAKWWSLNPIASPEPPDVENDWSNQPIDRFILAKLQNAGLSPSLPADQATLARRLYFATTGLPPSPAQIDAFVASSDPNAYAQLVDELLDSPQFGHRWARHWMDWLRYTQSHGSEGDPQIVGIEHYRDYLIRAFQADVPCNQLIREHIAGDLLENPRTNEALGINESLIGTAHWRMVFHGFAPTDALDERVRFTDDAIDVVTKAFLGLTVSCARCHDHKFDAISQSDYYATFGIVSSTRPGRAAIETADRLNLHRRTLADSKKSIRAAIVKDWRSAMQDIATKIRQTVEEKAKQADANSNADGVLQPLITMRRAVTDGAAFDAAWGQYVDRYDNLQRTRRDFEQQAVLRRWDFAKPDDASQWFVSGNGIPAAIRSEAGQFSLVAAESASALQQPERVIGGIYPSAAISHAISTKHGSRLTSPDFHLDGDFDVWLQIVGDGEASSRYVVQNYPRSGTVYPVTNLNADGYPQWRWQHYDLAYWNGDDLHLEMATARDAPLLVKDRDRSWFGIRQAVVIPKGQPQPTDWREDLAPLMKLASDQRPDSLEDLEALFRSAIERSVQAWSDDSIDDAGAIFLDQLIAQGLLPNALKDLPSAEPLVSRYRQLELEIPVATRVPSVDEWAGRDHPLFIRGDHKQPADAVPRRFLEVIDATPYQTRLSGRRQWAEDLVADDNPLVARVMVNRVWHHLFGTGLVATTDNFGRLGETPSHPELLDYLASRFRDSGWSFKQLIREIVTSRAWRQQSIASAKARRIDPDNRLLSYRSVTRLEAEAIRDALLFVSDQLQMEPPTGSASGKSNQRSVYVDVRRNALDPFLTTFDAPVPFTCKGRRDVTNVPAQALLMMNDPFVIRAAERLADAVLNTSDAEPASEASREVEQVTRMWRRALSNDPSPRQRQDAMAFLERMRSEYAALQRQREHVTGEIRGVKASIDQIIEPVRERLLKEFAKEKEVATTDDKASVPDPIAGWSFDKPLNEQAPSLPLAYHGSATVQNGALVLDGQGWAQTPPIDRDLTVKSLEAIVQLDTLQQAGGGVFSVQTVDGVIFDAIVFGEQNPRHWLSGSNNFRRTQPFGATPDDEAATQPIHLIITYAEDGTITCYRNGQLYGKAYKAASQAFQGAKTQILLGMRHGTSASGNRMLQGRIFAARLYDFALNPSQVQSLAGSSIGIVTDQQIEASLQDSQRQQLTKQRERLVELQQQQEALGPQPKPQQAWIDLAHALLNLKEFIYVR